MTHMALSNEEMMYIVGGGGAKKGKHWLILAGLVIAVFLFGVLDGIVNPKPCNSWRR